MSRFSRMLKVQLGSLLMAGLVVGCGSEQSTSSDGVDAALMEELLGEEKASQKSSSEDPESSTADSGDEFAELLESETNVRPASSRERPGRTRSQKRSSDGSPPVAVATGEKLELNLRKGDRFPLIKTVEQTLVQKSEQFPASATTRLQLTMAISVEDVRPDAILLSVRYSRVNYAHDLNGQRLEYDSAVRQGAPPLDVAPYAGMVNNGFAFWLGRDNQIRELVGYQDFLYRCVELVPAERRQSLLAEISARFGDDGVANFVDDSIGLLPYDSTASQDAATKVLEGDMWTRERRLMQPAPVYMNSSYQLMKLTDRTAEIAIKGTIASGETVSQADGVKLKILGGNSFGNCSVDRATGLPLEVNVTRFVNMEITTADGRMLSQDKQIVTTIRAFPENRGPVVQTPAPNNILPVSGTATESSRDAQSIPVNAGSSRAVRAAYPE